MTDLNAWIDAADKSCPLRIERSEWDDPVLLLGGTDWSLSVTAPWRIVRGYIMRVGAYDESAKAIAANLIGERVTRFRVLDNSSSLDIGVTISSGDELQVFCASKHENWVLRVPAQATMAFVPAS
ncbi:hypothetical protein [Candidatus Viadribacter manganicus]|uniref:Uncharacterized protein n=1 Tax=Candidatus Viadribacter manganicus TaxID=1759059 RepID=A0A1B1AD48_9PROT|nr:hypothetical protein [Candidatus Viadribacter manganicus]ANP44480.1 hypothetical protein ATE48_00350 [Candidatus Viadribacter manganicus]